MEKWLSFSTLKSLVLGTNNINVANLHVFYMLVVMTGTYSCRYWSHELERKTRGQRARLWMVMWKCIWLRLLLQTILTILEVCCLILAHYVGDKAQFLAL